MKKEQWYNEYKTDERMNVIGQNGNDGQHYESKNLYTDKELIKLKKLLSKLTIRNRLDFLIDWFENSKKK